MELPSKLNSAPSFGKPMRCITMVYEFFIFEDEGIIKGAPHHSNCPMMEYPIENHEEKYRDYVESNWYLRKLERINRGRKRDGLKPINPPRR